MRSLKWGFALALLTSAASAQTYPAPTFSAWKIVGSSTGLTTFASANAGATNYTITFPAATGTVALTSQFGAALPSATASQLYVGSGAAGVAGVASTLPTGAVPAFTGDVTNSAGTLATTVGKIGGQTIALAGGFSTSGAYSIALTATGATALTLPTSGTLATTANINTALPSATTSQIYGGSGGAGVAQIFPLGTNVSAALQVALNAQNGIPSVFNATLTSGHCLEWGPGIEDSGSACAAAGVSSLGNVGADTSLTIAGTGSGPWTGVVTAKINLSNAQTWAALQTFTNADLALLGTSTGKTTLNSGLSSTSSNTLTLPITATDTLAGLGTAQTWTALQKYTNADFALLGSSTGYNLLETANAGASNFITTFPGATDTVAELTQTQTLTNKTISIASNTLTGVAPLASPTFTGTITAPDGGTWGASGINATMLEASGTGNTVSEVLSSTTTQYQGPIFKAYNVNSSIGNQAGIQFNPITTSASGATTGAFVLSQINYLGNFVTNIAQYDFNATTWSFYTNGSTALTLDAAQNVQVAKGIKFANLADSATAPTISSGCGGGSPSISAPNGTDAFVVTIGTASGSTCTLTMPTAANGWNCMANDITTHTTANSSVAQTASATNSVTVTGYSDITGAATWVSGDKIAFMCRGF